MFLQGWQYIGQYLQAQILLIAQPVGSPLCVAWNDLICIVGAIAKLSLLELSDLRGATVTIDAIGCQKAITEQTAEQGAGYVLALKDNHPQLHEDVRLWLDTEGVPEAADNRNAGERF
jgi:hypothetical protein